jgi:MFS family permease
MQAIPLLESTAAVGHRRWRIAWLLGFGVLISYMDRVNISVAQKSLHDAFGLTTISFGYLLSAYSWTYAVMQLPAGVLLDRFGIKRVGLVGSFLWTIATFATAAATSVTGLFSARFLLGIGEAPIFPMNAKAIGSWFPERERGLPTAIFDAAAKFSPALGIPLVGLLLLHFGWRASFAVTGLLSLLFFILFARIYRTPEQDPHLSEEERAYIFSNRRTTAVAVENAVERPLGWLARQRKVIGLTIGFATYNYSFYLLLTWLPSYVIHGLHVNPAHAVWAASIPWFFAGCVDLAIGGWLVDELIRRGRDASRVRRTILLAGMACGLGVAGPALTHQPVLALTLLSIGLGGLSASAPVAWSIPTLLVSPINTGKTGGIMNFGTQFAAISAPIFTGYLISATHSFAAAFALAAVIQLGGIAAYALLMGRIEPIPAA